MRMLSLLSLAAVLAGCASGPSVTAGMKPGEFVHYACEGGKRLSARAAADGTTVRVRHEGGYELDRKSDGSFEADGWKLTRAGSGLDLAHKGKTVAKGCKPA